MAGGRVYTLVGVSVVWRGIHSDLGCGWRFWGGLDCDGEYKAGWWATVAVMVCEVTIVGENLS